MRWIAARSIAQSSIKMALHPPQGSKLIFAPSGPNQSGQADQFTLSKLTRSDLDPNSPITQFHKWFSEAQSSPSVPHPETCCFSTAELPSGRVSSRMVYLKELESPSSSNDEQISGTQKGGDQEKKKEPGFVIYTNTGHSRKAADLTTNPYASLLFFYESLQRQIRIEGPVQKLTPEESQVYYNTRIRSSRLGAWASKQSQKLQPQQPGSTTGTGEGEAAAAANDDDDGRAELEGWVKEVEEKFEGQEEIPVPPYWGGLRVVPEKVEFWQGRESRLHDRFVYEKEGEGWTLSRLSP